jgi:catechol 2,3-dioxygenase-like lactoylglutathione lyase family enzyme
MRARTGRHLGCVALLVREYDEAKGYFADVLGFDVVEDTPLGDGKRWVLLAPPGSGETRLLLAKASTPEQAARVGDQAGGRVFLFLHTATSGPTSARCGPAASPSARRRGASRTARSRCSRTSTATSGT